MVNGFLTFLLFITDSVDLGVIGRRLEDVLILLLNLVLNVKFSLLCGGICFLSAAAFSFFSFLWTLRLHICIGVAIKW